MTRRSKKTEATGRIDIRKGYSERDAKGVLTVYAPGLYLLDPELSARLIDEGHAVPEGYVEPEPETEVPEPTPAPEPEAPTEPTPDEADTQAEE